MENSPSFTIPELIDALKKAGFATKKDLKDFIKKNDLKNFANKHDIKNFATKQDLNNLPTKRNLENFATKQDLNNFATKNDLKNLPTKDYLDERLEKQEKNLKELIYSVNDSLLDHMTKMETRLTAKIDNVQNDLDDWKGHVTHEILEIKKRVFN